jgi:hypothetical protein
MKDIKKCSLKKHSDLDAVGFCIECNLFICNKCINIHTEYLENHHTYKLDKNFDEIFTGICREENHKNELNYFCKTHNQLCCAACISKIKGEGNGQHTDCIVCFVDEINNEKRNILKKNIQNLESFSKTIENSLKELKQIMGKINKDKERLKTQIIKKFTEIRNAINEREDKLLFEIEYKFNEVIFKEDIDNIVKKSEKYPNIIKNLLEKGKKLNEEWDNNKEKLNSKINECVKIENSIKEIQELEENIKIYNSQKIEIKFLTNTEEELKNIIKKINEFGEINNNECEYKFKFKNGKYYTVSENGLVATKSSGNNGYNCIIYGDKEIPKNKVSKWRIKLEETKGSCHNMVGIGPQNNNNNIDNFYSECWVFCCYNSGKIIKSNSSSDYNGHSGKLKNGDVIEIIVDRISGNLNFNVNNTDYGIACSEVPQNDILYPVILLYDQNLIIRLV